MGTHLGATIQRYLATLGTTSCHPFELPASFSSLPQYTVYMDMHIDTCIDMCINVYIDVCMDMCIGVCICVCIDMRMTVSMDAYQPSWLGLPVLAELHSCVCPCLCVCSVRAWVHV